MAQIRYRSWLNPRTAIYRELSKSGIVALVLISVFAGYLLGRPLDWPLDWFRLAETLFGILLLASGSSALNQIQDQALDSKMPRTAKRPLPSGRLSRAEAWAFVGVTCTLGLAVLFYLDRSLFWMGCTALVSYNGLYTLWWKRTWAFAAIPGAIPGALPVWMGFTAASGKLWAHGAIYVFAILFFWQMPHFWVLALRYKKDYEQGGVPTLPVALGSDLTLHQISLWALGYVAIALLAPLFLGLTWLYLSLALVICFKLLWELRAFARAPESKHWLRFFLWVNFSLILFYAAMVIDRWSHTLFRAWMI